MVCDVCKGRGLIDNKRYWKYGCSEAYERGLEPTIVCPRCKGSGFIIGVSNAREMWELLETAVNCNRGLTSKETKKLLTYLRNKI